MIVPCITPMHEQLMKNPITVHQNLLGPSGVHQAWESHAFKICVELKVLVQPQTTTSVQGPADTPPWNKLCAPYWSIPVVGLCCLPASSGLSLKAQSSTIPAARPKAPGAIMPHCQPNDLHRAPGVDNQHTQRKHSNILSFSTLNKCTPPSVSNSQQFRECEVSVNECQPGHEADFRKQALLWAG